MAKDDFFPIQPDGNEKSRKHTDTPCMCLFLAVVAGMVGLTVLGLFQGDPNRLTRGRDYHGRLCGIDTAVAALPYVYYCGATEWQGDYPKSLNYKSRSCVRECPNSTGTKVACLMPEFVNATMLPGGSEQNVTFESTLNVEVTQSVAFQHSYPTQSYLGAYCVPQPSDNNSLYREVLNGPLKEVAQFQSAIGSFLHAWPVILGASVLAMVLGIVYLYVLKHYAGLLLYVTLWAGTIMTFFVGLFFLYGIFPDPMDELGWYQQASPIFIMSYGVEARLLSALVGLVVLASAVCMLFQTLNENIDESIGVISATVDCILGPGSGISFVIQPILQAFVATLVISLMFYGFMTVASVTRIDHQLMAMNGKYVKPESYAKSLEANEVRDWYWSLAMKFYMVGFVWMIVTMISICQFVISYAVCDWFFVTNDLQDNPHAGALSDPIKQAIANKGKRVDGVRVKGVDKVQGSRAGYIEKGPHGKVLVVPLGEKGPGGRDFIRHDEKVTVKKLPCDAVIDGIGVCVWYHLGTIAMAGVANLVTAPLRGLSEMIKAFMGNPGRTDQRGSFEDEDSSPAGLVMAGLGLLTTFLDEMFGRFSKNMYVDIVLRSTGFFEASQDAYDFIADAGGAVALLHGGTSMYEIIGVVLITATCSVVTSVVLVKVETFSDPTSSMYVGDPAIMTLLAGALAFIVSSAFMSLFNMAADSLLYVFAWARKQHAGKMKDFCPTPILHMMGKELEEEPALALQPHPRSRMTRFSHAAARYKDTVMATMTKAGPPGSEERPLLAQGFSTWR